MIHLLYSSSERVQAIKYFPQATDAPDECEEEILSAAELYS